MRLPSRPAVPFNSNKLICGFKNMAGRSRLGGKTLWSKGKRYAKRKFFSHLASPNGARLLGLVCGLL
jgi:hypothetical protein